MPTPEEDFKVMQHCAKELLGVIAEYRAMPCKSLEVRMYACAERYRDKVWAKCRTCYDRGVVLEYDETNWPEFVTCPACLKGDALTRGEVVNPVKGSRYDVMLAYNEAVQHKAKPHAHVINRCVVVK